MCERNSSWLPLTCPHCGPGLTTQARALTGTRTGDPLVHRPTLNPLSHTSQGLGLIFQAKEWGRDSFVALETSGSPESVGKRAALFHFEEAHRQGLHSEVACRRRQPDYPFHALAPPSDVIDTSVI